MILQEETQEYLEETKLKELVARYSEFINFPIYLYASKEVDVPADEAADGSEVSDEEEEGADDEGVVDDGEFACFFSWVSCLWTPCASIINYHWLHGWFQTSSQTHKTPVE